MIRFNLIITFLILSILIFGQKDYQSGYIVTNQNDTIFGSVKDRKSPPYSKIYKKIRFKDNNNKKKKYGTHQIKAYKQGDNQFESLWIDVSSYFLKENYTSIPYSGKKYFLKVIVKGYLTYYQWEFEDEESGSIWEKNLYKKADKKSLVKVSQGIFGLKKKNLAVYFKDCPELVNKIDSKEFKDPIEIAKFYNKWKKNN